MERDKVTEQTSPEMERKAEQRAKDRVRAARWDLDIAVFLFGVLAILIIQMTTVRSPVMKIRPI